MIGTTVGMIIQILSQPFLIRFGFYNDVELGVRTVFTSFYSVLSIIATLRFEMAIMLPKKEEEAYGVMLLSCITSFVFSVFLEAVWIITLLTPFNPLGLKNYNWMWMVPIITFELGVYNSCNYWLNRCKRYKNLAANRIIQQALIVAVSVIFSKKVFNAGINGMVIAYTAAQGIVMLILIFYAARDYKRLKICFGVSDFKRLFVRYIKFPVNIMPSGLVNQVAVQLPVWILTSAFGEGVVGQYSMTVTVLGTPITVIGQAVADVFRQKGSADYNENGECREIYRSTAKTLAKTAVIPFVLLAAAAVPLFRLILGDGWDMAAYFVIIMAPFYFIRFVVSPLTYMTIIAEKQKFELLWQVAMAVFTGLSLFVASTVFGLNVYFAIAAYSIAYSIMYIIHINYTRKLASGAIPGGKEK